MALQATFTPYDKGAMGTLTRTNKVVVSTVNSCTIDMNTTVKCIFKIDASGLADGELITIQAYGAKEVDENGLGDFYKSMRLWAGETYANILSFTGNDKYLFEYSVPNSAFIKYVVTSSLDDASVAVLDIHFRSHQDY